MLAAFCAEGGYALRRVLPLALVSAPGHQGRGGVGGASVRADLGALRCTGPQPFIGAILVSVRDGFALSREAPPRPCPDICDRERAIRFGVWEGPEGGGGRSCVSTARPLPSHALKWARNVGVVRGGGVLRGTISRQNFSPLRLRSFPQRNLGVVPPFSTSLGLR